LTSFPQGLAGTCRAGDHVHTNGIENFWGLLKRGLNGTYVAVEPFHLDAYVSEQVLDASRTDRKVKTKIHLGSARAGGKRKK